MQIKTDAKTNKSYSRMQITDRCKETKLPQRHLPPHVTPPSTTLPEWDVDTRITTLGCSGEASDCVMADQDHQAGALLLRCFADFRPTTPPEGSAANPAPQVHPLVAIASTSPEGPRGVLSLHPHPLTPLLRSPGEVLDCLPMGLPSHSDLSE